jgi:hypothetical protein
MTYQVPQRPIYQKTPKAKPDPDYLARVRSLPCIICEAYGMVQNSPTEAHHAKSGRYGQAKSPDRMAISLCHSHHHKLRSYVGDADKIGFHNNQAEWERRYGPDTDWIAATMDKLGV